MCHVEINDSPVIVGIEEISSYLRRSRGVVRRMVQSGELPVTLKHGAYMTSKKLLDEWLQREATQSDMQMT